MISWIVASHQPQVLANNLLSTLEPLPAGDELVVVRNAPSIAVAYADGQARATQPIRAYIHQDIQVLDVGRLRGALIATCLSPTVGIVGVIGSLDPVCPWWTGRTVGSAQDSRVGAYDFGPGGPCAIVDGILLATAQTVAWDVGWPGWHGYDHDACRQMLARGLENWCLDDGRDLLLHNTTCPGALEDVSGWAEAEHRYRAKWEG